MSDNGSFGLVCRGIHRGSILLRLRLEFIPLVHFFETEFWELQPGCIQSQFDSSC